MKLRFTLTASRQLDRVLTYLDQESPQGKQRVQARIAAVFDLLLTYPQIGSYTAKRPRRRLIATPFPYAITYRVDENEIVILGVRHTSRQPEL